MQNRHMFTAFALGAAVGGLAALLTAPEKGEATRKKVKRKAQTLAEDTKSTVGGTVHDVAEAARTRKDAVREAVTTARDTYQEEMSGNHSS